MCFTVYSSTLLRVFGVSSVVCVLVIVMVWWSVGDRSAVIVEETPVYSQLTL